MQWTGLWNSKDERKAIDHLNFSSEFESIHSDNCESITTLVAPDPIETLAEAKSCLDEIDKYKSMEL